MKILAIDPGKNGAFASLENGVVLGVRSLPTLQGEIDCARLAKWIDHVDPHIVAVEAFQDHVKATRQSMIAHAMLCGEILGVAKARYEVVVFGKQQWQDYAGIPRGEVTQVDEAVRRYADKWWPGRLCETSATRTGRPPQSWYNACVLAHAAELQSKGTRVL